MVRLTIELDDETYARLAELAQTASTPPERAAAAMITRGIEDAGVSAKVRAIIGRQIEAYGQVFRRLGE